MSLALLQRLSLLFCIALLLIPTSSCRRGAKPGTLVIAIEIAPRGFDPRFSTTFQTSARIMQLIYDTLVVKNEKFDFVPSLAETFQEPPNLHTFPFHLHSHLPFHNTNP